MFLIVFPFIIICLVVFGGSFRIIAECFSIFTLKYHKKHKVKNSLVNVPRQKIDKKETIETAKDIRASNSHDWKQASKKGIKTVSRNQY